MNLEKMKKVANNGGVKVAERIIALMGIPLVLAFLGWMSSTLVDVGEEVTIISVRQEEIILPKLEKLERTDYIKRSEFEDEEDRNNARMDRLEIRINRE
jgi:hypothetical protein